MNGRVLFTLRMAHILCQAEIRIRSRYLALYQESVVNERYSRRLKTSLAETYLLGLEYDF